MGRAVFVFTIFGLQEITAKHLYHAKNKAGRRKSSFICPNLIADPNNR